MKRFRFLQGERVAEDIEEITDPEKLKKIFEVREGVQRDLPCLGGEGRGGEDLV